MSKETKITGVGTVNYVYVERKSSHFGEQDKYSIMFIYSKDDYVTQEIINGAINDAIELGFKTVWKDMELGKVDLGDIKSPIRDGDDKYPNKKEYSNSLYFVATTKYQPTVVDRKLKRLNPSEVYSGCRCMISINCYPYVYENKIGVAINLNNILKVSDGEKISNVKSAEEDFAKFCE